MKNFVPQLVPRDIDPRVWNILDHIQRWAVDNSRAVASAIDSGNNPGPIIRPDNPGMDDFFYLPGRPTGQVAYGSSSGGGSLKLRSTRHSTKGLIYFGSDDLSAYDGANNLLGLGLIAPTGVLHAQGGDASSTDAIANSTLGNNGWATVGGAPTAHEAIDQRQVTPSDYVQNTPGQGPTLTVGLSSSDPGIYTGITITIRARRTAGADAQISWNLNQGVTSKANGTIFGITTDWADYTDTVSEAEALSITNWGDLNYGFSPGGAAGQQVNVNYVALRTLAAGAGTQIVSKFEAGTNQNLDLMQIIDASDVVRGGFTGAGLLFLGDDDGDKVTFGAHATTTAYAVTFPAAQGAAASFLLNDGAGALTWDTGSGLDHGALGGLLDDDHTQYLLLAGRTGQFINDRIGIGLNPDDYTGGTPAGSLLLGRGGTASTEAQLTIERENADATEPLLELRATSTGSSPNKSVGTLLTAFEGGIGGGAAQADLVGYQSGTETYRLSAINSSFNWFGFLYPDGKVHQQWAKITGAWTDAVASERIDLGDDVGTNQRYVILANSGGNILDRLGIITDGLSIANTFTNAIRPAAGIVHIENYGATNLIPLVIRRVTSQAANLLEFHNEAGSVLESCVANGLYSGAPASHNILGAEHADAATSTAVLGGMMYVDGTPEWVQLAIGAQHDTLRVNGVNAPAWDTPVNTSAGSGDSNKLGMLDATGKWDASMIPATGGGITVVSTPVALEFFMDRNQKFTQESIHGALSPLAVAQPLNSGADIVVPKGIGKLVIVVNAGSDLVGDITVTGTSVDRNTGAETGSDTDTVSINGLTTDNSDTDAQSNVRHALIGAYITSKWFVGSVTLSTADVTLTDVDVYHCSFEQYNDEPAIHLSSFDIGLLTTNANAFIHAYLYSVEVTGDVCNVTREASVEIASGAAIAGKYWRLRRGGISKDLVGTTDGIFVDMFLGPTNQTYFEDISVKVWATVDFDVSATLDHGALSGLADNDHGQYFHRSIDNGAVTAPFATTANVVIDYFGAAGGSLQLANTDIGGSAITILPPTSGFTSWTWTLPTDNGSANGFLATDGAGVSSWVQPDHGNLAGLNGDDHAQYFLLAGRAGSQDAFGGTATGESLILSSTAHATKGIIRFGEDLGSIRILEATNQLSINSASATGDLHVVADDLTDHVAGLFIGTDSSLGTALGVILQVDSVRDDVTLGVTQNVTFQVNATITDGFGGDHYAIESNMDASVYASFPTATNYGSLHAFVSTVGTNATAYTGTVRSIFAELTHADNGTAAALQAISAFITVSGGSATLVAGISLDGTIGTGETATDWRGVEIKDPGGVGTITTLVGLYIENMTKGGTDWAIYSAGGDSYFLNTIRVADAIRLIEAGGASTADYIEIKAPATVGTSYGIELDDNGPSADSLAKFAALSSAVTIQTFVDIPTGRIFIPTQTFTLANGTPTAGFVGTYPKRYEVWDFSASVTEAIYTSWTVPDDYKAGTALTFKVVYTEGSSSGNNWVGAIRFMSLPDTGSTMGTSTTVTTTIAGRSSLTNLSIETIGSSSANVTKGDWVLINFERTGASGSDTHPGIIRVIGVIVEYTRNI